MLEQISGWRHVAAKLNYCSYLRLFFFFFFKQKLTAEAE